MTQDDEQSYPPRPQFQPYAYPVPAADVGRSPFRAGRGLSRAVIALSFAWLVLKWIDVALELWNRPARYVDGYPVPDGSGLAFAMVGQVLTAAVWAVTCTWLGVAYGNAKRLDRAGLRRSEVWVWLGWIVPIVLLWFPKQVVDDSLRVTEGAASGRPPAAVSTRTGWWWGMWLAGNIVANLPRVEGVLPPAALPPGSRPSSVALATAAAVVLSIALVRWVLVVLRLAAAQDRLASFGVAPMRSD